MSGIEPSPGYRQAPSYAFHQGGLPLPAKRREVGRCSPVAAEEGLPVIVEVLEGSRNVDGSACHFGETCALAGAFQAISTEEQEADPLIPLPSREVEFPRRIPEVPQHLHAAGVVSDAGGDCPTRSGLPHRQQSQSEIGHEIDH
jgi:hypothetical protein